MTAPAIRIVDLRKLYRLGALQSHRQTFREAVVAGAVQPFRRVGRLLRGESHAALDSGETLWALDGVSHEICPGEVLGIIGRNGAGKSTLLKVLARITEPTAGRVELRGRVGSLLEVGTGFHAELTGRENVYLNAAILGMQRAEIARKFDRIVEFAGVEAFIDTPIKHYSSGMGLRLGFAVAAHLEPEILLVDEVLAVGDLAFQQKCLGKIDELTHQGRTVLFVSHNLYAVHSICERVIWMDAGKIRDSGPTDAVVARYRVAMSEELATASEPHDRDTEHAAIGRISVNGNDSRYVNLDEPGDLEVVWEFQLHRDLELSLGCSLSRADGTYLSGLASHLEGRTWKLGAGRYTTRVKFPSLSLHADTYVIRLSLMSADGSFTYSHRSPAATLYVETPFRFDGLVELPHAWMPPAAIEVPEEATEAV